MRRESHVRFCEGRGVKLPSATRLVVGFQHKRDAERFLSAVKERFGSFELELHPDKTRLIEFGKYAHERRHERGQGRPETFDFLGFTHYCNKTRKGVLRVGTQAGGEADETHTEADQGGVTQTNARQSCAYGKVAGEGAQRMAELLCCSEQFPIPEQICLSSGAAVVEDTPPPVAEGPLPVESYPRVANEVLAQAENPTPVAMATIRRHYPREEPRALAVRGRRGSKGQSRIACS